MSHAVRTLVALALVAAVAAPVAAGAVVATPPRSGHGATAMGRASADDDDRIDFDGDGYEDLAIGAPTESVDGLTNAGAVHILFGTAAGLSAEGNRVITRSSPHVASRPREQDHFGIALATGDFDGDGRDDLAASGPGYANSSFANKRGSVSVLYGSPRGLTGRGDQIWTQETPGIPGTGQHVDAFGWALTAGDFDADGYEDLAIGVPMDSESDHLFAGGVHVLHGSPDGLSTDRTQYWSQADPAIVGEADFHDHFGLSLAVGNLGYGPWDDLVVGVAGELRDGRGAVAILFGSDHGLTADQDQLWSPDDPGVRGEGDSSDGFGRVVAVGDLGGGPQDDLAVASPHDGSRPRFGEPGYVSWVGSVNVMFATKTGLTAAGDQRWTTASPGMPDTQDRGDRLGQTLLVDDLDGDGWSELLATASYGRSVPTDPDLGPAHVVYVLTGTADGPTTAGVRSFEPGFDGIPEDPPSTFGSGFGAALTTIPGAPATTPALVIGAPGIDRVYLLPAAPDGPTTSGLQTWQPGVGGVADVDPGPGSFGDAFARRRGGPGRASP